MTVPLWMWLATVAGIAALISVDLWRSRRPHEVGFREAAVWSAVYVAAALLFGAGVLLTAGTQAGIEFFSGYLVEKSLSIDNLFVFAVVLAQFGVSARHQARVLMIGVIGALVLRGLFIAVGAAAVQRYAVMFLLFGAFLIFTGVRLFRSHGEQPDIGNSRPIRLLRRVVPMTDDSSSGRLLIRGRATPLLLAVLAILAIDIVFALDSIPAIFGITDNAYLVFTTNAFALLGLRALYFLMIGLLDRLVYLHYGLAILLGFIGVKLVLHYLHGVWPAVPAIPLPLSMAVIVATLAVTTVLSLRRSRPAASVSPAQSGPVGHDRGADPVAGVQLDQDRADVGLHRALDEVEGPADLGVGVARTE
jgi:tellurite resistance protein TerC